jgi:bacterioferritin-associated ferredoxin
MDDAYCQTGVFKYNKIIMAVDIMVCTCMEVYESEIIRAIKEKRLTTVEAVGEATGAGTICGDCKDETGDILERINK